MKFAIEFICLFLTRRLRRKVRFWYKWRNQGIVVNWAMEVLRKKNAIDLCKDTVQVLVLGSSHGEYGFIPDEKSFNLCGASQDLYLSYELYRRCAEFPKLKTVILFYSVFSSGAEVERTMEKERCLYYRKFWGIPYRFHSDADYVCKEKSLDAWLAGRDVLIEKEYRGLGSYDTFMPAGFNLCARIESHLKNNNRVDDQCIYVSRIAELAAKVGHRAVVVIPPVRSDYFSMLPPFDEIFERLKQTLQTHRNLSLISFMGDGLFSDEDFGDSDHLTLQGAGKLTKAIFQRLEVNSELDVGAPIEVCGESGHSGSKK